MLGTGILNDWNPRNAVLSSEVCASMVKTEFGYLTAEARLPGGGQARRTLSKEFLIMKHSELCELCASVVNTLSQ